MTFGKQKRQLLGWLAFLAPLPLPFNDIVEWWVLVAYLGGVLLFLRRARRDPPRWLPVWGLNVLGIAYLPVFLADLFVFDRGHLTHPVLHLCLFSLLVKLFALTRERDKWQAAMGVFFLFLASMGTSVHPAIALFLVAFLALTLALLMRFAFLHVLAGFGREDESLAHLPIGGFLAFASAAVVVLAVPLFALLPRVRSPYIVGRGTGTGATIEAAGFSDAVTLDSIGRIRGSREVAMRLQNERGGAGAPELVRFKAATYDLYDGGSWRKAPLVGELPRGQGVRFWLARGAGGSRPASRGPAVVHWMKIWLQPLHSRSLPLPVETAVVEPRVANLLVDEGGAVALGFMPLEVLEYRVGLARQPVLAGTAPAAGPGGARAGEPTLDPAGVSPRMAELAGRVMGAGPAEVRAGRLETYLMQSYDYTQDFRDRSTENPIEDFLFRYKSGHCEYFASAMVLLLRSQGIPARLVTGFLGGEYNPFEGYTIVRNTNAHAWVEAYLADSGQWRIFDPTPPAGRPAEAASGAWPLAHQAYDFLLFRWDRYVLTYGLYDQIRIVSELHDLWERMRHAFDRRGAAHRRAAPAASGALAGAVEAAPAPRADRRPKTIVLALLFAALAMVAWSLVRAYRAPLTATRAYRRLRRRASGAGLALADSVAPLAFRRAAAARYPQAAVPAAQVIELYLRESFGERPLAEDELDQLREALSQAVRGLRKAAKYWSPQIQ
jgi:hypothetical protein